MLPVLLGLSICGLSIYFLMLFFQFQKIERKLDDALKDVEVFMLKEFGEITPDSIMKSQDANSSKKPIEKTEDPEA